MRERGLNEVKVMPIVKVDVHAPIFYFPNLIGRVKTKMSVLMSVHLTKATEVET